MIKKLTIGKTQRAREKAASLEKKKPRKRSTRKSKNVRVIAKTMNGEHLFDTDASGSTTVWDMLQRHDAANKKNAKIFNGVEEVSPRDPIVSVTHGKPGPLELTIVNQSGNAPWRKAATGLKRSGADDALASPKKKRSPRRSSAKKNPKKKNI